MNEHLTSVGYYVRSTRSQIVSRRPLPHGPYTQAYRALVRLMLGFWFVVQIFTIFL